MKILIFILGFFLGCAFMLNLWLLFEKKAWYLDDNFMNEED